MGKWSSGVSLVVGIAVVVILIDMRAAYEKRDQMFSEIYSSMSAMQSKMDAISEKIVSISYRNDEAIDGYSVIKNNSSAHNVVQQPIKETLEYASQKREQQDKEQLKNVVTQLETTSNSITRKDLAADINALSPKNRQQVFDKISQMIESGELDPNRFFESYLIK